MVRKFKKSLGQNFLRDNVILDKIFSSIDFTGCKRVIEIGPGDGALTKNLIHTGLPITAIEIDNNLANHLAKRYINQEGIKIINQDILKTDLKKFEGNRNIFVGNLPYNISSQIILNLLESGISFNSATFLIQKELANRFAPKEGKSTKISLQANFFANVEQLFDVHPEAFVPKPKVTSTLIKISPHNRNQKRIKDYARLKNLLSLCFANPRKQIRSSLRHLINSFEQLTFEVSLRPEELALKNYFEILDISEEQI